MNEVPKQLKEEESEPIKPEAKNPVPITVWVIFSLIICWGIFYLFYNSQPQSKQLYKKNTYMTGMEILKKATNENPANEGKILLQAKDQKRLEVAVDKTISKTVQKTADKSEKIENQLKIIENDLSDATKLFNQVTYNKKTALISLSRSNNWKKSLPDFISVVSANSEHNGFNSLIANLSDPEWKIIFEYLKKILK